TARFARYGSDWLVTSEEGQLDPPHLPVGAAPGQAARAHPSGAGWRGPCGSQQRREAGQVGEIGRVAHILATRRVGRRISAGHHGCVDRKSTRLNSSHTSISYAVLCLKITTRQIGLTRRIRRTSAHTTKM